MGRLVDLDDVMDSEATAAECGLSSRKVLAACLSKRVGAWRTFPEPVIDDRHWLRPEVRAWDDERKRHPMKSGPKPKPQTAGEASA